MSLRLMVIVRSSPLGAGQTMAHLKVTDFPGCTIGSSGTPETPESSSKTSKQEVDASLAKVVSRIIKELRSKPAEPVFSTVISPQRLALQDPLP